MKHKTILWIAILVTSLLTLSACKVESNDVATLNTNDTQQVEAIADVEQSPQDNEAMIMALTECLRENGIDAADPVVDADGNVQKPTLVEGAQWDEETMGDAWEACEHHLEGFTFEEKRVDTSEMVDQYMELAACLREKGYDLDDPTAETLDIWMDDFKNAIDWDDPDAIADYEECSGETVGGGGKNE